MTNQKLTKNKPEKGLTKILKKKSGRSNRGRISVRHQGGRVKRRYRLINFSQKDIPLKGKVEAIEYDPNRTCYIALVLFESGKKSYILCPQKVKVGDEIVFDEKAPLKPGNRMKLKNIPSETPVHNVELSPGEGGRIARSAGNSCFTSGQEGKYVILKMPSKELRKVFGECFASIGALSNPQHRFKIIRKAGLNRLKGKRPAVRGSAMNAVDHPHGGGEDRSPIGLKHPKTPWGKPARGVKTRKRKKGSNKLIIKRRK